MGGKMIILRVPMIESYSAVVTETTPGFVAW